MCNDNRRLMFNWSCSGLLIKIKQKDIMILYSLEHSNYLFIYFLLGQLT